MLLACCHRFNRTMMVVGTLCDGVGNAEVEMVSFQGWKPKQHETIRDVITLCIKITSSGGS